MHPVVKASLNASFNASLDSAGANWLASVTPSWSSYASASAATAGTSLPLRLCYFCLWLFMEFLDKVAACQWMVVALVAVLASIFARYKLVDTKMKIDEQNAREQRESEFKIKQLEFDQHKEQMALERESKRKAMEDQDEREAKRRKLEVEADSRRQDHEIMMKKFEEDRAHRELELATKRFEADQACEMEKSLQQPKQEMVEYATAASEVVVETTVLESLDSEGFKFFAAPAYFCASIDRFETSARAALSELPTEMQEKVVTLLTESTQCQAQQKVFTFSEGQGNFATVMYKMKESKGQKACAVLPYGMTFDCARVVDHYQTIEIPVPIHNKVPRSVLAESGFFTNTYRTEMESVHVRTETRTESMPIFKPAVLSVDKLDKVMKALEYKASKKALANMK